MFLIICATRVPSHLSLARSVFCYCHSKFHSVSGLKGEGIFLMFETLAGTRHAAGVRTKMTPRGKWSIMGGPCLPGTTVAPREHPGSTKLEAVITNPRITLKDRYSLGPSRSGPCRSRQIGHTSFGPSWPDRLDSIYLHEH